MFNIPNLLVLKTLNKDQLIRLAQVFSAKLVLEVFGGAGAIWGFSEAVGLRVPHTVWFWRPAALTIGAIFFVRWLLQMEDFALEFQDNTNDTKNEGQDDTEHVSMNDASEKDELLGNGESTSRYV